MHGTIVLGDLVNVERQCVTIVFFWCLGPPDRSGAGKLQPTLPGDHLDPVTVGPASYSDLFRPAI